MGLESASYIEDLNTANPTGNDPRSQGDDQMRLIKTVLKASLPNGIDLRNLSSESEYAVLRFDGSNQIETRLGGHVEVTDSAIASVGTGSYTNFSGDTEVQDDPGMWAAGNPTRFTVPTGMRGVLFTVTASWSGKIAGYDNIYVGVDKNGAGHTLMDTIPVYAATGSFASQFLLGPLTATDYYEIGFKLVDVLSGDTAIALGTLTVKGVEMF